MAEEATEEATEVAKEEAEASVEEAEAEVAKVKVLEKLNPRPPLSKNEKQYSNL